MFEYKCLKCNSVTYSPRVEVERHIISVNIKIFCKECGSHDFRCIVDNPTRRHDKNGY